MTALIDPCQKRKEQLKLSSKFIYLYLLHRNRWWDSGTGEDCPSNRRRRPFREWRVCACVHTFAVTRQRVKLLLHNCIYNILRITHSVPLFYLLRLSLSRPGKAMAKARPVPL